MASSQAQGCCFLHFPDDPCDDCPVAHPEVEQFCADCGIGETEEPLAEFPRHGDDVLLCGPCWGDAEADRRLNLEETGRAWAS